METHTIDLAFNKMKTKFMDVSRQPGRDRILIIAEHQVAEEFKVIIQSGSGSVEQNSDISRLAMAVKLRIMMDYHHYVI